jgi:hypothetical protein
MTDQATEGVRSSENWPNASGCDQRGEIRLVNAKKTPRVNPNCSNIEQQVKPFWWVFGQALGIFLQDVKLKMQ